ncbi:MAG: hypothetical protein DHS20C05_00520 [Hyphococcus sp.]|nr:MAG: hypothetical protein DHS20C05_00520 [Marinicaulis sp.]
MHTKLVAITIAAGLALSSCQNDKSATTAACAPLGQTKEQLMELRANDFVGDETFSYDEFALAMIDCLGDPDPELRDTIGYESFAALLRGKRVTPETTRKIKAQLINALTEPDQDGFRRPFAALVLAEIARTDRVDNYFTPEERDELIDSAAAYMESITDYRGYEDGVGWRHAVAHNADLLMQLALNDELTREQYLRVRDAVVPQIIPQNAHFYVYGEDERLARPVLFIARRGLMTEEEWTAWFESVASKGALAEGEEFTFSQEFLARRHNLNAFATMIYVNADASESEQLKALLPGAMAMLRAAG